MSPPGAPVDRLELRDLARDGAGAAADLFELDGSSVHKLAVRCCRFTNLVQGAINKYVYAAFRISGVADSEFVDCLWHNPAKYAGYGMAVLVPTDQGAGRIVFTGANRFLWLNHAMRILSGDAAARGGKGPDNTCD